MSTKVCTRCRERKCFHSFQRRSASNDGMTASCKSCLSKYDKIRARLPHRVKAREEYQKTEIGREKSAKAKKKYIESNPIKRAVHVMTGNAIRDGKIIKSPCEVCGDETVHAHHDDYCYPMSVRWLCPAHHKEWHEKNGEGLNAR